MVSQEQIKENLEKLAELESLVLRMERCHNTALQVYHVHGVEKTVPQEDVDGLIEDYQGLKTELQEKFKELL